MWGSKAPLVLYVKKYVESGEENNLLLGGGTHTPSRLQLRLFFHSWESGAFVWIHEYDNSRYAGGEPFNPKLYAGHKTVSKGEFVINGNQIVLLCLTTTMKTWRDEKGLMPFSVSRKRTKHVYKYKLDVSKDLILKTIAEEDANWLNSRGARWSPQTHRNFPPMFKDAVKTVLLISNRDQGKKRKKKSSQSQITAPVCGLWSLPREVLFLLFEQLADSIAYTGRGWLRRYANHPMVSTVWKNRVIAHMKLFNDEDILPFCQAYMAKPPYGLLQLVSENNNNDEEDNNDPQSYNTLYNIRMWELSQTLIRQDDFVHEWMAANDKFGYKKDEYAQQRAKEEVEGIGQHPSIELAYHMPRKNMAKEFKSVDVPLVVKGGINTDQTAVVLDSLSITYQQYLPKVAMLPCSSIFFLLPETSDT